MEMLFMCHLKLFSLPYSPVELGVGCAIVTHHVTPEPVTEVAVTPSPPTFGLLHRPLYIVGRPPQGRWRTSNTHHTHPGH